MGNFVEVFVSGCYIVASIFFIVGLKRLSSPETARQGNMLSAFGMFIAVLVTLFDQQIVRYDWIIAGILIGSVIGVLMARLSPMTAMPQMVAVLNGFGGMASLLIGWGDQVLRPESGAATSVAVILTVIVGGITFTGSMIAFLKLSELIPGRPFLYAGQKMVNLILFCVMLLIGILYVAGVSPDFFMWTSVAISLLLGVLLIIPIGGADMPVVISLLNSYSGIAAALAGFVLLNNVLIVSGSLVGASGIILTSIMCKAMNRSLANVLFSGFGSGVSSGKAEKLTGEVRPISADDAYLILEAASNVVIIPGYGMAVSQAQHAVRELSELLEANGAEVKFAIHPVAGRMPGHMNVLLAEANVSYDTLVEPDSVNPLMETVDVCIVIGANDVVNPAAKTIETSPIYGMPIIEAERAKTVFVLKRSMGHGFSGVDNPLFFNLNTRMLFGDAKTSITSIVAQFKS